MKPKRKHTSEPKPFAGLTQKPLCTLCEQVTVTLQGLLRGFLHFFLRSISLSPPSSGIDLIHPEILKSVRRHLRIFDTGGIGVVLIGMPGIEKRLSRYPQLYSRVGFVHAFRPLSAAQVRELLQQKWLPSEVMLPEEGVTDKEALAAMIRVTGSNFRLLHRLLTQIARLMEINALQAVTSEVVEAARESLVIGIA